MNHQNSSSSVNNNNRCLCLLLLNYPANSNYCSSQNGAVSAYRLLLYPKLLNEFNFFANSNSLSFRIKEVSMIRVLCIIKIVILNRGSSDFTCE